MNWITLRAILRQYSYPRAFRFQLGLASRLADTLAPALAEQRANERSRAEAQGKRIEDLQRRAEDLQRRLEKAPQEAAGKGAGLGIPERTAIELCNEVFRLRRNAEQMVREGRESKELQSIQRVRENIERLLGQHGVQYFDLTGRSLDDRDNDFEPFGQPEDVPGLTGPKVGKCERPLVKINGKMVQRARGVVQRPV